MEFEKMRDGMDLDTRKICAALLLTGMRYAELQRFRENPDWLDGKFVYLPRGSMLKVKAKQRERAIRLSDMGKTLVPDLFQASYPLPELPALNMKMRRLSKRILEDAPVILPHKTVFVDPSEILRYLDPLLFFFVPLRGGSVQVVTVAYLLHFHGNFHVSSYLPGGLRDALIRVYSNREYIKKPFSHIPTSEIRVYPLRN